LIVVVFDAELFPGAISGSTPTTDAALLAVPGWVGIREKAQVRLMKRENGKAVCRFLWDNEMGSAKVSLLSCQPV